MKLRKGRDGSPLNINKKVVPFSYWPTRAGEKGNHSLQPLLFSLDPWAIIDRVIKSTCHKNSMEEAMACMNQARDFYEGATEAGKVSAKPLYVYYCFMNLAKAFCLTRGVSSSFDKAQHGLSEQSKSGQRSSIRSAYLDAYEGLGKNGAQQIFSNFMRALTGNGLSSKSKKYHLAKVLPQILPGHRLWAFATGKSERFIAIHEIETMMDKSNKTIWLRIYFMAEDFTRLGISHQDFLKQSGLAGRFEQVSHDKRVYSDVLGDEKILLCFEQVNPFQCPNIKFGNYVQALYDQLKGNIWTTVATIPPYRRYYIYLCPPKEEDELLHQLLSVYAVSYYLSSITRYRPHHFDKIADNKYGPRIQDFITGQPLQFLYLIASEFARQQIAKPSIL